jgi:hypothetical protein
MGDLSRVPRYQLDAAAGAAERRVEGECMNKRVFSVRLSPEISDIVRQAAEQEDRPITRILLRYIRAGLEKEGYGPVAAAKKTRTKGKST